MTEARAPLVSMIVVSYNHARFVLETLESVKAQTYSKTELIIIDDCSTDDSVARIEKWLQRSGTAATFIKHEKNMGVCRTLNDALAVAKGKYISMIASDDLWLPEKIEQQVEIMEAQPEDVGVLYSDAYRIDGGGRPVPGMYISAIGRELSEIPPLGVFDALLKRNFIPGMTTLIRRSCYDRVGPYDEGLLTEDWDMWLRIARHYSFFYSPTPSAKYRFHQDSFSHSDLRGMLMATLAILAKQLALGGLSEGQKSIATRSLALYSRELAWVHLGLADRARRSRDRAATIKHLTECAKFANFRLPGGPVTWASLLGYGVFGVRRLRWWKGFNPASD